MELVGLIMFPFNIMSPFVYAVASGTCCETYRVSVMSVWGSGVGGGVLL